MFAGAVVVGAGDTTAGFPQYPRASCGEGLEGAAGEISLFESEIRQHPLCYGEVLGLTCM
jgi:hypothetical protein